MATWNEAHRNLIEKLERRYGKLTETKDHLINRLANLSDEEKQQTIEFFHKHPEAENRIDWNKKDLVFADFKKLMDFEGVGRTATNKAGLAGLEEGADYDIMDSKPGYVVYIPYTYDGSRIIASNSVKPVLGSGAQWCTAYQGPEHRWYYYTDERGEVFAYVCDEDNNEKWAIECKSEGEAAKAWDWEDHSHDVPEKFRYIVDWVNDNWDKLRASIDKGKEVQKARDREKEQRWLKNPVASVKKNENGELVCIGIPSYVKREQVTRVIVPKGVTSIGEAAFGGCRSLMTIEIPDSVTLIGHRAFYRCKSLGSIDVSKGCTVLGSSDYGFRVNRHGDSLLLEKGPSGGIVFYDKGSYSDGWRYLEAAPEDITVGTDAEFAFGFYRETSDGTNLFVNGSTAYVEGTCDSNDGKSTGTAIGTGKANTEKLVDKMGSAAYTSSSGSDTTADYAAKLCDNYTYGGYSDWFLPSKDELDLMYENLMGMKYGFHATIYWSSSEHNYHSGDANFSWTQLFDYGSQSLCNRLSYCGVRAVRAF